jgi:hypothetical protein
MDYKECKRMVKILTIDRENAILTGQWSLAGELEKTIASFERLQRMH